MKSLLSLVSIRERLSTASLATLCFIFAWSCGKGGGSDDANGGYSLPPSSVVVAPPESPTNQPIVTLTGTALQNDSTVRVEGGSATRTTTVQVDRSFTLDVILQSNKVNHLAVTEIFADGTPAPTKVVDVVQDSLAPELFIDFPPDGATLSFQDTNISGRVGDMLSGFAGLTVDVNGKSAPVDIGIGTNGTFDLEHFLLSLSGPTTITVIATDKVGNSASKQITASFASPTGNVLLGTGGGGQTAKVNSLLPKPLEVRLTTPNGAALASKVVTFKVVRSDGRLSESNGTGGTASLSVQTNANGRAQVFWQLGSDAGCGNNRVEVSSKGVSGVMYFSASAAAGKVDQINVGSGGEQACQVDAFAPEPLRAWISDGCNGAAGVVVEFSVDQGDGSLTLDGSTYFKSLKVNSAATGHAQVLFRTGTQPGTNLVSATFSGNPGAPAVFSVRGRAKSPQATTSFNGHVLDNAEQPIEGVECTLVVAGTTYSALTNSQGVFDIPDIQEFGMGQLHVEGATAVAVGGNPINPAVLRYPALHYEPMILQGVANAHTRPILLPAMDPANDVAYNGTSDVVLRCVGIAQLQMVVKAGSATFLPGALLADGSRLQQAVTPSPLSPQNPPVLLSLNQVHADDIPMRPGDGAAPPFAWTMQPGGTQFSVPVAITYPNMSGLPAGAAAFFLSFNHDTGRFEIVASGRVGDDALTIQSDPGVGIRVAGWGCNCPPYAAVGNCDDCTVQFAFGANIANAPCFQGAIKKSIPIIWFSQHKLDLLTFVPGISQQNAQLLQWYVNGVQSTSSVLDIGFLEPPSDTVRTFDVRVVHSACPTSATSSDQMRVVVVPTGTLTSFLAWESANTDMTWLAELPAPYTQLGQGATDPEPFPPVCVNQYWEAVSTPGANYHPCGVYELRSEPTAGGHGHQVIYGANGVGVFSGIGAGTADKRHWTDLLFTPTHKSDDVQPFIWAAQLDGNPVNPAFPFYTSLSEPLMYVGDYLDRYLAKRPIIPNNKTFLLPTQCGP